MHLYIYMCQVEYIDIVCIVAAEMKLCQHECLGWFIQESDFTKCDVSNQNVIKWLSEKNQDTKRIQRNKQEKIFLDKISGPTSIWRHTILGRLRRLVHQQVDELISASAGSRMWLQWCSTGESNPCHVSCIWTRAKLRNNPQHLKNEKQNPCDQASVFSKCIFNDSESRYLKGCRHHHVTTSSSVQILIHGAFKLSSQNDMPEKWKLTLHQSGW